jgi:3-oxoacyl-[acyl-carrier-protein] synthase-3
MMSAIAAVAACVPDQVIENDYFSQWHDAEAIQSAADLVGLRHRYWAPDDVTTIDITCKAAQSILDKVTPAENLTGTLRENIDLLIFVTQTPDALMPGAAYKAHAYLGLPESCACISVNAGCSGYVENVALACDLLEKREGKYALLLVGDVLSQWLSPSDRSTALIFGDAGTATLIDNASIENHQRRRIFVSGSRSSGVESIHLQLNKKNADKSSVLFMNGMDVFNFTISQIPNFIKTACKSWEHHYHLPADPDLFLLHQANRMIIEHVVKKLRIPAEKVPINIHKFGNTSGATIPLLMQDLLQCGHNFDGQQLLLSGFGVGLGWGAMIMDSGPIINAGLLVYSRD